MISLPGRVFKIGLKGVVPTRAQASALLGGAGDVAIVRRGRPRWLVMICPSGCGDEFALNLDTRAGPAWRMYRTRAGLTLYPSVWRESGCGSHFVIWNNRVWWIDGYSLFGSDEIDRMLEGKVMSAILSGERPLHYTEIADMISEIPWPVLLTCRTLMEKGAVREREDLGSDFFERF